LVLFFKKELLSFCRLPLPAAAYLDRYQSYCAGESWWAAKQSLAMLERLVQRRELDNTPVVEAEVPPNLAIEDLLRSPPPNWSALGSPEAAAAGGAWLAAGRSPLLRAPSALVPQEPNFVVNPAHPDASSIVVRSPMILEWDARLFGVPAPKSATLG
jgi:RES domain-containing protein